ncbi:MAG: CDP-alcohol phosphatidyltransferase family protein [Pseudomonadota bacterium]
MIDPVRPWRRFAALGAILGGFIPVLAWATTGAVWTVGTAAAVAAYCVALILAVWSFRRTYPHPTLGLCNGVTLIRLALVSALVAPLVSGTVITLPLLLIATLAFALDWADGWLARRTNLTSGFGARFDVEVDSVFALLLACLAIEGGLHPVVLLLGLPRYAFGLAQLFDMRFSQPLPERFSRKVVCVVQIATLIGLTVPWIDPDLRHGAAVLCAGLVTWSFAVDIRTILWASAS